MSTVQVIPNMRAIIQAVLGKSYVEVNCWALVRHIFLEAFGLDLIADPVEAAQGFAEIWFKGDEKDLLSLVQPYDLLIIANHQRISQHLGVIVDDVYLVHTRQKTGVVVERLTRWKPHILQLARLRSLL